MLALFVVDFHAHGIHMSTYPLLNSFIEDGKNPDLFTKSFIECVAGENQFTNGKITAMKVTASINTTQSWMEQWRQKC